MQELPTTAFDLCFVGAGDPAGPTGLLLPSRTGSWKLFARREQSLLAICEYILSNPVRKRLVEEVGQWPFAGMPDPLPLG